MKTTKTYRFDRMTIARIEEMSKQYDISSTEVIEQAVSVLFSMSISNEFGDDIYYVQLPDGKRARVELKN